MEGNSKCRYSSRARIRGRRSGMGRISWWLKGRGMSKFKDKVKFKFNDKG